MRLDYKEKFPDGMEEYLSMNGWHFNKKMCEWASSRMYKENRQGKKEYIEPYTRESFNKLCNNFGIKVEAKGYDDVYIANMCKADFLGSSVLDEINLVQYVKDVVEDPDAYEGMPFTRFYADCIGSGTPIPWEDVL